MNRSGSHDSFERIEDSTQSSREEVISDAESICEDDIQVLSVKIHSPAPEKPEDVQQSVAEMLDDMERRLLSVIYAKHEQTTAMIKMLEARVEGVKIDLMKGMEETVDVGKNRSDAAGTMQTNEALLNDIAFQVAALKDLQLAQKKAEEERREHAHKKRRHCEAAKKSAIECYDKIKTHVRALARGASTSVSGVVSRSDSVDVAAEAQADNPELKELKLIRKSCKIAFRCEGRKDARRWFVARVVEPEPCVLREGDEILTIGGEQVSGVSLERLKELVAASNATVEVRRAEKAE